MAALQTDYLSIPARQILPLYWNMNIKDEDSKNALDYLKSWDYKMLPNSIAAGIYNELESQLKSAITNLKIPPKAQPYITLQVKRMIDFLTLPDGDFGDNALEGRDLILRQALKNSVHVLEDKFGSDMNRWQYGQEKYKHIILKHPLSNAVSSAIRSKINVGPAVRGGYSNTVNSTGGLDNQPSGGSFRMIVDAVDWDHCLATNTPGQNGNPEHPHYKNLFELWAKDSFFPLFYSRTKVLSVEDYRTLLIPE